MAAEPSENSTDTSDESDKSQSINTVNNENPDFPNPLSQSGRRPSYVHQVEINQQGSPIILGDGINLDNNSKITEEVGSKTPNSSPDDPNTPRSPRLMISKSLIKRIADNAWQRKWDLLLIVVTTAAPPIAFVVLSLMIPHLAPLFLIGAIFSAKVTLTWLWPTVINVVIATEVGLFFGIVSSAVGFGGKKLGAWLISCCFPRRQEAITNTSYFRDKYSGSGRSRAGSYLKTQTQIATNSLFETVASTPLPKGKAIVTPYTPPSELSNEQGEEVEAYTSSSESEEETSNLNYGRKNSQALDTNKPISQNRRDSTIDLKEWFQQSGQRRQLISNPDLPTQRKSSK